MGEDEWRYALFAFAGLAAAAGTLSFLGTKRILPQPVSLDLLRRNNHRPGRR